MNSNDQHCILGSIIGSVRRNFSKISEMRLRKAGYSKVSSTEDDPTAYKVLDSDSKPKNIDVSKDPKSKYIWEVERGDGHYIRCFYYGWVLERMGRKSNYRLRNPTIRRVLDLPDTGENRTSHMLPVYLSSIKTFKMALAFPNQKNGNLGLKVLTVGVDDKWRKVDSGPTYKLTNAKCITKVIGEVFVVVILPDSGNEVKYSKPAAMIFFEVESERVWSVDIPVGFVTNGSNDIDVFSWDGKPALARKLENDLLYVWVVEDFKTQKWAGEKIMVDLTCMNDARRYYSPYWFYGNELLMHRNCESYLKFDIVSKAVTVTHVDAPKTPGMKIWWECSGSVDLVGAKPLKE